MRVVSYYICHICGKGGVTLYKIGEDYACAGHTKAPIKKKGSSKLSLK